MSAAKQLQAPPEVLTLEQAAALLQLCTKTIVRAAEKGEIPHRKVGAKWRFTRVSLLRWVDGNR